jgi:transcriptional regulator with XRE-family HTH domain
LQAERSVPLVLSPEQSRAARAWLGWSQAELAKGANVSLRTIQAFEKGGRVPMANNITAIRRVLEIAGIRFLFARNGTAAGIARREAEIGSLAC